MPRIFRYDEFPPVPGALNDDPISVGGTPSDIRVWLYRDGVETGGFSFLDGSFVKSAPLPAGVDNGDTIILSQNSGLRPAVIWDEQTQANFGGPAGTFVNLWIGAPGTTGRYGLPSGAGITQIQAYETIIGSSGDDLVKLDYNASTGGQAYTWNITIYGGGGRDIIVSGEGNDALFGGDESSDLGDGLWGQGGNDTIYGGVNSNGGENDDLYGGSGDDTIYGSSSPNAALVASGTVSDEIWGDEGNDVLFGGSFVGGVLQSGSGNDTFYGGNGDDTMIGGDGADTFFGGNSSDPFASQPNVADPSLNDTVSYEFGSTGITANLETGANSENDVYRLIENLTGSAGDDMLTGSSTTAAGIRQSANNRLSGLAGADSINGGDGNDTIYGGTGNDSLSGNADTDIVFGDAGNDTISGSSGAGGDTLYGGTGAETTGDWVMYGNSASVTGSPNLGVTVNLATSFASGAGTTAENDRVFEFENVEGSAFNDSLTGTAGVNSIIGGDGNDTVEGGDGADSMSGGAGTGDFLSYANSSAGVFVTLSGTGNGGDATGDTFSGFENLIGSANDDRLTGSGLGGQNTIYGGGGVDTVDGLTGIDTMYGGGQGDFLFYMNATSSVQVDLGTGVTGNGTSHGGDGDDIFFGFQHVFGSNSDDILTGNDLGNSLIGGAGADLLSGNAGIDSLFGGAGNDTLVAGVNSTTGATTTVSGWDGDAGSAAINVTIASGASLASDFAFGGSETDTLDIQQASGSNIYNTPNSNISSFLAGVEIIVAGAAADVINLTFNDGGTRTAYAESVSIFAGDGSDIVFSGSGDDLVVGGLRTGTGSGGRVGDTLYGGQGRDIIYGDDFSPASTFGNNDLLFGGAANDTVYGGLGDDTIYGGTGTDQLNGGAGNDFLYETDGSNLLGDEGADILVIVSTSSASNYNATGGSDVLGSDGADLLFAGGIYGTVAGSLGADNDRFVSSNIDNGLSTGQVDRIFGESGDDALSAWFGNDSLDGGDGNDALWGGAGVDTIFGKAGTDYLYGGAGDGDVLVGGDGLDYYYWTRLDGVDRIDDQDTIGGGQGDNIIIVMPGSDASGMFGGQGVFETDHDLYDAAGGDDMVRLTVDTNGDADGSDYILTILQGPGAGSQLYFDSDEVQAIALWNNDAASGTPVITIYEWDEGLGRYVYHP